MKVEKFVIANLKCSGCENSIKSRLIKIEGVGTVMVNQDESSVTVETHESTLRSTIGEALHDLGYPEATEENGLLLKMKSYASCMVGRLKAE